MRKLSSASFMKDILEILRIGTYSVFNSHKYKEDSLLYPFVNFKTLWNIFLTGKRDPRSFDIIKKLYIHPDGEGLVFKDIRIPTPITEEEIASGFLLEIQDLIIPYLYDNEKITNGTAVEGPYELGKVHLSAGDIVIDAGSNMGVFSAIAGAKGCTSIAFEPIPYCIENYLKKTAAWNKNIIIAPYALSDTTGSLSFATYDGVVVAGHRSDINSAGTVHIEQESAENKIEVPCITLDDYVSKYNLNKVDFIKADIEGSERFLLKGAKQTLREFAPKISICTYHLADDPKVLRQLILEANPKYNIFEKYKKMYAYAD